MKNKNSINDLYGSALGNIEGYLSSSGDGIGIDRHKMQAMEEPKKTEFVRSLLQRDYRQSFPIAPLRVMGFEKESDFARQYISVELYDWLKAIIERIKMLYGLSPNFPPVAIVENWNTMSNSALELIKKSREVVLKILMKEYQGPASSA
jgi:hypothetical protein